MSLLPIVMVPDSLWSFMARFAGKAPPPETEAQTETEKRRQLCERKGKGESARPEAPKLAKARGVEAGCVMQALRAISSGPPPVTAARGCHTSRAVIARATARGDGSTATSSPSRPPSAQESAQPARQHCTSSRQQEVTAQEAHAAASAMFRQPPPRAQNPQAAESMDSADLQAAIMKPQPVRAWKGTQWERVKKLQEAKRNSGCVDLMRSLRTGQYAAVKRMPTEWVCSSAAEFAEKYPRSSERPWVDFGIVTYLHGIGYPHVCQPLGMFADHMDTYVVSEFASDGDLFTWCHKQRAPPGPAREAVVRPLVQQICLAVYWLHECGIAHRDLSLENMVLTRGQAQQLHGTGGSLPYAGGSRLEVKLIDFGMATVERHVKGELCGKPSYQAPEMHGDRGYDTFLADSFSLGVTFYCMGSGDYPWMNTRPGAESDAIFRYVMANGLDKYFEARKLRGKGKRVVEVFTPEFLHFLRCLMEPDPSKRYTLGELFPAMMEKGWLAEE